MRRRIVLQCNVSERGVVDVVTDIQKKLAPIAATLPPGYFVEYGGQFQSQKEASRVLGVLFIVSLIGVFLTLFVMFRSVNLSLQVMAALPMAFIGSVFALVITGQTLTIAAMVGFISLAGIASRNGILLLNHYLHLVKFEGETWSHSMIIRAGLERLGSGADDGTHRWYRTCPAGVGGWRAWERNPVPCRDCDTRWCHKFDTSGLLRPSRTVLAIRFERSSTSRERSHGRDSIG